MITRLQPAAHTGGRHLRPPVVLLPDGGGGKVAEHSKGESDLALPFL